MSIIEEGLYFIDTEIITPKDNEKQCVSYVQVEALHPKYRVTYYFENSEPYTVCQRYIDLHPLIKTTSTTTKPYSLSVRSCF